MQDGLLHEYAARVTAGVDDPAVRAAFARVPRHLFVPRLADPAGGHVDLAPERAYTDEALVTQLCDGLPSSSSSQPSLMARMLAALRLRPGMRVLEIGAGTGYNAALIATITGAPVVSVDVQPEVVDRAEDALARAGVTAVEVVLGDGYEGTPKREPFDRIIATVGVAGVPPTWLERLAPGGSILAPVEHGGYQPCLLVTDAPDGPVGHALIGSGFMRAAGRLHPHPVRLPPLDPAADPPRLPIPPVPRERFVDRWFWLAAHDPRCGLRYSADGGPAHQHTVTDPHAGAVVVESDALRPVDASPDLVAHVFGLVAGWHAAGGPPLSAWRCDLACTDDLLWEPTNWRR
jgi:protein-L-isoaspartate(D-aspartate) O-methyltransferase